MFKDAIQAKYSLSLDESDTGGDEGKPMTLDDILKVKFENLVVNQEREV